MLSKRNRASFLIIVQLSHCHCLLCIQVVFQFSSNFKSLNRFISSTCLLLFKCVYSPNFVLGVLIFFRCFYPSHDPQYVCWCNIPLCSIRLLNRPNSLWLSFSIDVGSSSLALISQHQWSKNTWTSALFFINSCHA